MSPKCPSLTERVIRIAQLLHARGHHSIRPVHDRPACRVGRSAAMFLWRFFSLPREYRAPDLTMAVANRLMECWVFQKVPQFGSCTPSNEMSPFSGYI